MQNFEGSSIVIAGGGFSAVAVLAAQIEEISSSFNRATHAQEPIKITIVNPKGRIGPGGPYDHDTDIYKLNQPAYAMSPLHNDPTHFTRWLVQQNPNTKQRDLENSFQSRALYGQYLNKLFDEVCQKARDKCLPVTIETIEASVDDASYGDRHFTSILSNGQRLQSDCLIVADGHHKNGYLGVLRGHDNYYEDPLTTGHIQSIPTNNNCVLIVGSGQTMVDRISELEQAGYEGDIHIVSRKGVMPWKFDPELYRDDTQVQPYKLKFFTPEKTARKSYEDCINIWAQEIAHAERNGYGPAHALKAYFDQPQAFYSKVRHPEWHRVTDYIQAYYGNPTPPPRYQMLQSGRIIKHVSPISAERINSTDTGFEIDLLGTQLKVDAIFNSAGCARTLVDPRTLRVRSPLIAKLDEKGLIKWTQAHGILAKGEHGIAGLYTASPYEYDGKWGVETFRENLAEVGKASLKRARENHLEQTCTYA